MPSSPEWPVEDRKDDVRGLEPATGNQGQLRAVASPHAVASDLDVDDVVAAVLEAAPDRRCRGERHIVFGGPAAAEHHHAAWAHGTARDVVVVVEELDVVGVVVVDVEVVGLVSWPTMILTVLPFLAIFPPAGDCRRTMPF